MSLIEIIIAILIIVMCLPLITHFTNLFIGIIPTSLLTFLTIAVLLKIILFIIHRGDEG